MIELEVFYGDHERRIEMKEGENLLQTLLKHRVPIEHECDGMASCGTCRILVTEGGENLPKHNELETEMVEDRGFADNERLACQLCPRAHLKFRVENWFEK